MAKKLLDKRDPNYVQTVLINRWLKRRRKA
jgi:hypothetical protein